MKKFLKSPAGVIVGLLIAYVALNGLTTHWDDQGDNHPRVVRPLYGVTT
jgi:hypothetical protein